MGPWRGEVGFEVLYWIPFVRAFAAWAGIPPERLIPITRGGMGQLYQTPVYLELFAMRTPQQVRIENRYQHARTGMLKQMVVSPWDRSVLADAALTLKLSRYHVLHPAWMYQTLSPFWDGRDGIERISHLLDFTPLTAPPKTLALPDAFVAVKWYARATFPASPMTASIARETITQVAATTPVVLLSTGVHADDHIDFEPARGIPNVYDLRHLTKITPEQNLLVQAEVISRSLGVVAPYGGLAQLALRYRRPSLSLYTDWHGTAWAHRHLSEMLAWRQQTMFTVLRVGDVPMIQSTLPSFQLTTPQGPSTLRPIAV